MNLFAKTIIGLIGISIISCSYHVDNDAKVIFTFDDQYIDSWWSHRELFSTYEVKASFFVCRPQTLNQQKINQLRELMHDGHDIGCHGYNHISASEFVKKSNASLYFKNEIQPAIHIFDSLNIPVKTFAYPFGHHSNETDSALLKYFKGLRLATYKWEKCSLDSIDRPFCNGGKNRVVNAIMIDKSQLSLTDIEKAIIRAKMKRETLIFLAHGIDSVDGLFVKSNYLKDIFAMCKKHQIESITFSQLWEQ